MKILIYIKFLLALSIAYLSFCPDISHGKPLETEYIESIPLTWVAAMNAAFEDFTKKSKNAWKCYRIISLTEESYSNIKIVFGEKEIKEKTDNSIFVVHGSNNKCGPTYVYIVAKNAKIVSITGIR